MKGLINYFIKFPIAANLLMFALLILGLAGLLNMKSTFFPETESRIISIRVIYPGSSPEEIEEGIVNKIEENLKGVTGVERFTSVSSENSGSVTVEVFQGYDTDIVLQDVKNAVDQISSFPVGMEPPIIYKLENLGQAITFSLSGDVDLRTLKRFGREVEEDLLAMDGISKVSLSGFPDEEIEITFREADLRAYNLTFQEASQAVRNANIEITGGTIKSEREELLVRARNKAYYAEGLRDVVLKRTPEGGVVYLHQVADLQDRWADNPDRSFLNGNPSVVVNVQNTLEEDMLSITRMVRDYIEAFNAENEVVKANIIRDASETLNDRIQLLVTNGIIGFLIVLVLLAMFLNWRLAFWVALAIPVSFAGMFICAQLLDVTINVISLFGMILVIGILVDDGIVIGENIYQQYEQGKPPLKAALEGTLQVLPAVFAAILTTVIAFGTFLFIEGRLGDIFKEMAIVVIFSLIFSLVEGATILAAHIAHSKALTRKSSESKVQRFLERCMDWLRRKTYAPVLRFSMENKLLTVAFMIALLWITLQSISGGIIRTTFFPVIERDNVNIELRMPAGTRDHITERYLQRIEDAAWAANDSLSRVFFRNEKQVVQQVEISLGPTTYEGSLNVEILNGEERDSLLVRDVTNAIREKAGSIPQAERVTYGAAGVFGKPISISLVGDDYQTLQEASARVRDELNSLAELTDVVDNNQEGLREIEIELKPKAEYLGLRLQDIVGQVRDGFFGNEVQRLQRGRDEVRVWVRYDLEDRADITQLENMRVRFADGREFPLSEIATLQIKRGVISINHLDGKREIQVEADIANNEVSVSDITASLKESIVPAVLKEYPGVSALYEGQNREQEKSARSMQTVGGIAVALIFFIVAVTFRSVSQTVVVLLLIPFSFIGVGWGHWLMGAPISLFSALGIIALIGVLVNDSLVLVTTYNDLLEEGHDQMDAVYQAGLMRFRPIILTTFTTFAGLAPLLFEKSLQAQFLIPMAISVSYGLLAVTVVNLLLLPVLLIFANRFKVYATWLWNGEKPREVAVESAVRTEQGYEFLWVVFFAFVGVAMAFAFFGDRIAAFFA